MNLEKSRVYSVRRMLYLALTPLASTNFRDWKNIPAVKIARCVTILRYFSYVSRDPVKS